MEVRDAFEEIDRTRVRDTLMRGSCTDDCN